MMILIDELNKFEQCICYIPDNSRNILFKLTYRVEIFEWEGKEIPQGDSIGEEGVEGSRRSGEGQIKI